MTIASPNVRAAKEALRKVRAEEKAKKGVRTGPSRPSASGEKARQPKRGRVHDNPYLAWIRRLPCVACEVYGVPPYGAIQACHVRFSDAAKGRRNPGLQVKPSDRLTVPLCRLCHSIQHGGSERAFWAALGIEPAELMTALSDAHDAGRSGAAVIREFGRKL